MTAQQLKNSILQMAVQGKLVPQDPNDEPASVLLERIWTEKEEKIKEGKIKKEKNPSVIFRGADNLFYEKVGDQEPVCIADEVPFDIPDSWEWVRFSNVCFILNGDRGKNYPAKSTLSTKGIPFVSAINLDGTSVVTDDNLLCLSETQYNKLGNGKLIKDDIIICIRGSLGKHGRYPFEKGAIASSLVIARPVLNDSTYSSFVMVYLDSPLFFYEIKKFDNGTAQPNLAARSLEQFLFPLPPANEQMRILNALQNLYPYIEEYKELEDAVSHIDIDFPNQLKKSILQMAVQGKLVPQDPNDEPASVLLEKIRAEKEQLIQAGKIKRDKHESVIYRRNGSYYEKVDGTERCIDNEIPFDIPENWEWCRLKTIVNVVSARRVHQSDWRSEGIPFYRAREIAKLAEDGFVDNELFISPDLFEEYKKSGVPHADDLMVTAVGTLGKTYIVKSGDQFYYKDASVICFENFGKSNSRYLQLVMQAPFMESIIKENSFGTTVNTITITKANNYWIPLPPLAEQERIVEKSNQLLIICNKLS